MWNLFLAVINLLCIFFLNLPTFSSFSKLHFYLIFFSWSYPSRSSITKVKVLHKIVLHLKVTDYVGRLPHIVSLLFTSIPAENLDEPLNIL